MNDPTQLSIYQLRAVLNGVSPLVWRRFLLSSETSLADLHRILQLAFGWSGFYLYEFCIHGKTFSSNAEDPRSVSLGDFQLRPAERFRYRYNFLAFWESDLRLEATVPLHEDLTYPRCVGGSILRPTRTTVAHGNISACKTITGFRLWKHCRCSPKPRKACSGMAVVTGSTWRSSKRQPIESRHTCGSVTEISTVEVEP